MDFASVKNLKITIYVFNIGLVVLGCLLIGCGMMTAFAADDHYDEENLLFKGLGVLMLIGGIIGIVAALLVYFGASSWVVMIVYASSLCVLLVVVVILVSIPLYRLNHREKRYDWTQGEMYPGVHTGGPGMVLLVSTFICCIVALMAHITISVFLILAIRRDEQ